LPAGARRIEGDAARGEGVRVALAASRFNERITERLLDGALRALGESGVRSEDVTVVVVPGAFELPFAARRLASSGRYDAVVCLGAVVRGDTPHFDYVAGEAARGIADAAEATGIPVLFGVLTTEDERQALDRSGGRLGNRGADAARAAVEMVQVARAIDRERTAGDRAEGSSVSGAGRRGGA
jgi:6,7-dimethyl-8-ribityllumazine synthase